MIDVGGYAAMNLLWSWTTFQ